MKNAKPTCQPSTGSYAKGNCIFTGTFLPVTRAPIPKRDPICSLAIAKHWSFNVRAEEFVTKFSTQISTMGCKFPTMCSSNIVLKPYPMNEPFSLAELIFSLKAYNRRSSPGADRIRYHALRSIDPSMHYKLLDIYNEVWRSGIIPDSY